MAGIAYLYEEYKKDPKRVEQLLDEDIEISEKLDGSRFSVQASTGSLSFFKRKDMSITKIDRTLSKYYEKAIIHFDNFDEDKIASFPDGWRFGMEYFPNLRPVTIAYDKLPLNNLVLTDIQVKDPKDKTIDVITDKAALSKWADILEVEKPPIIFEGKLTDRQKNRILDFLNTPYNLLVDRFKTENFTNFMLTLLNPQLKSSFLHNNDEKDIEGLVFKFGGKESFKVSNPEVALRKAEKRDEKPSDIYNLTLVILQEYLVGLDFNKIKLKEKTYEDRYIEFISKVFNLFVESPQYKKNFEKGVDFELPQFLSRAESNVNFNFVKDPLTIDLLEKNTTNRELFKIMMASMRSHKKKPSGFFSKELVYHHNSLVDKIANYVDFGVSKNLKETSFCSFREFKNVFLTESSNWQEEFGKEKLDETEECCSTENSEPEIHEPVEEKAIFIDHEDTAEENVDNVSRPLSVLKKVIYSEDVPGKKKHGVCLMMGKFQLFHNGHNVTIEDAAEASGQQVFLIITARRLSDNGVSRELHKSMLDKVLKDNKRVCGYEFSDGKSLKEVIEDLPDKFEPTSFAGSQDECDDVSAQSGKKLKTYPMTRHLHSKTVLQKIKDEDFDGYKKLVPESLHNYFYKLKLETKLNDEIS